MNRREALATFGSALAAGLLATWRLNPVQRVPLEKFCDPLSPMNARWDITAPYAQEQGGKLFAYATDAKIILRTVDPTVRESLGTQRPPPAATLPWNHDGLRGWKPWPKENHIVTPEGECPVCNGYGTADGKPGVECHRCEGFTKHCKRCKGTGLEGAPCAACHGNAIGLFPHLQPIGGSHIAVHYDRLVRVNLRGLEWTTTHYGDDRDTKHGSPIVAFRFEGGLGLLMPMEEQAAKLAIERARNHG